MSIRIGNRIIANSTAYSGANTDLSNLSEIGNDKLNVSKMYLANSVSEDTQGFNQLKDMYHSTFDLSKFEVVGSPTITSDGVASGFSSSDYLKLPLLDKDGQIEKLRIGFNLLGTNYTASTMIARLHETGLMIYMNNTGRVNVAQPANFGIQYFLDSQPQNRYANCFIEVILDKNSKQLTASYYENETLIKTRTVSSTMPSLLNISSWADGATNSNGYWYLGYQGFNGGFQGSIDLKQFSITVDGVPVFNGNKTGLDVIKPDNYTVVGSPTISEDGILSNLSVGNYVNAPIHASDFKDKSWKIKGAIVAFNNSFGSFLDLFTGDNYNSGGLVNQDSGKVMFYARTGTSSDASNQGSHFISSNSMQTGKKYYYELSFDIKTGTYDIIVTNQDGSLFEAGSWTPETENKQLIAINNDWKTPLQFGKPVGHTCFKGSQDLNLFEVWIDDQLVYQPCLKIPYTESKTGSKIVPAYARDRVEDVYEQYGQAKYYTIDEENKNFTLPMGEIYGMIGEGSSIEDSETIVKNDKQLDAIGVKSKSGKILYDWIGTREEYESGIVDGSISEDWICWVTDEEGGDKYRSMPIGSVFSVNANSNYVPDGCLPCDGAEYTKAQFSDLWDNYLACGKEAYAYGSYYVKSETPQVGDIVYKYQNGLVETEYTVSSVGDGYIIIKSTSTLPNGSEKPPVTATRSVNKDIVITLLNTCTYTEYEQDLATYGQCSKFAVDTDNLTFRVPLINKVLTDIADTVDVRGNGLALGLTNGTYNYAMTTNNSQGNGSGNCKLAYGLNVGATPSSYTDSDFVFAPTSASVGVTSDTTKSGIVADTTNAKIYSELRYFVVVANGQTNQSMMDWSAWASSLQGKANVDLANVEPSQSFIDKIIEYNSIDYTSGIDITFTSVGLNYTVPVNGVLSVQLLILANNVGEIQVNGVTVLRANSGSKNYFGQLNGQILVGEGDVITSVNVNAPTTADYNWAKFYPMKGAN